MRLTLCLVGYLVASVTAFLPRGTLPTRPSSGVLRQLAQGGNADEQPSSSRLAGNQRLPSADEIQLMDEMIERLAIAKPYELPSAVKRAFRVIRSPPFFLRIAMKADEASSPELKAKYEALAANLVSTLEVVVETTEEQLDERATDVEKVVQAAAEPDSGEFLVPLVEERLDAMRAQLAVTPEAHLDEGFLTTLDAWVVKSHQDGMDLMVGILQKVLQFYAALQIRRTLERGTTGLDERLAALLAVDADEWDAQLATADESQVVSLKKSVQKTMETVVFSLEVGSMAQQVQAEYLKELLKRVEAAEEKATSS